MSSSTAISTPSCSSLLSLAHLDYARSYRRGEILSVLPDLLWRLESGFIRTVAWHYEGQAATLGIWGPGDFLGKMISQIEDCQFECLTPVMLKGVSVSKLPYYAIHEATQSHLVQSQRLLNILHCRPMQMRLMQMLIWLAHRFGSEVERGWILDLRLTHQALADSIGSTRVTVTRVLKSFEKEGRLKRLGQHQYFLTSSDGLMI
jgi:CRP-like cAMP-binding protein